MTLINGGHNDPPKVAEMAVSILRQMKLRQWLINFGIALHASRTRRGAVVTPFLEGAITHLNWAAQYIRLLEADLHWLSRDNKALRKQVEQLGGAPAAPFRPDAEEAATKEPTEEASDAGAAIDAEAGPT